MKPDWGWQDFAHCYGEDLVLFFGVDGERGEAKERREREARQVCAGCPVRDACLTYALSVPEKYGTWGGLNEDERALERRRRMRRGELEWRQTVAPREKRCTICRNRKSIDEFGRDKHSPDGLNHRCRVCVAAAWRRTRAAKRPVAS